MIKDLIKLSKSLKEMGYTKHANIIEGVITQVHGKGPEEPVDLELGDFSDLGATNITKDEAFDAGCSACGNKDNTCGHHGSYMAKPQLDKIQEYAKKLHDELQDGEQLDDWMESHIAKMDQMMGDVYHKYSYKNKEELMEGTPLVIARRKELNNLLKTANTSAEYIIKNPSNSLEVTTSDGNTRTIKILEIDTGWYDDSAQGGLLCSIDGEEHEWEFHTGFYADGAAWRIMEKLGEDNNSDEPTELEETIESFVESQVVRNPRRR